MIVPAQGDAYEVEVRGVVLGATSESDYPEAEIALAPGDAMVLYTDGVLEARAPERIHDGIDVARAAQDGRGAGPAAITEAVTRLIDDPAGRPPRDDVAILVVQAIG